MSLSPDDRNTSRVTQQSTRGVRSRPTLKHRRTLYNGETTRAWKRVDMRDYSFRLEKEEEQREIFFLRSFQLLERDRSLGMLSEFYNPGGSRWWAMRRAGYASVVRAFRHVSLPRIFVARVVRHGDEPSSTAWRLHFSCEIRRTAYSKESFWSKRLHESQWSGGYV